MGIIDKYYGIKFPFTIQNNENIFLDLNNTLHEKVASEIAHVILTPKNTRIRMPNFGTDLIKYIFSINDNLSWGEIENEIKNAVSTYVPDGVLYKIDVYKNEENNDNRIFLSINFGVKKGKTVENNKMIIRL